MEFPKLRDIGKGERILRFNFRGLFCFFHHVKNSAQRWNTATHRIQRKCVVCFKQHKTVRMLHLFRQYSALTVVVSSAFLVTGTNIASNEKQGNSFSGYFYTENNSSETKKIPLTALERQDSISIAPLAIASSTIDPEASLDEPSEIKEPNTILASADLSPVIQKDPEEDGGVSIYTIEEGDTISEIAKKYSITVNTILWANDINNIDEIRPGDQIFILPIAGLKYIVQEGDTVKRIAEKYHGETEQIIAFNNLPANGRLETGKEIIIPDGYKETPPPTNTGSIFDRRQYATSTGGSATDISGWRTPEGKAGTGHKFPYGYCTWYVAQKRYIPWGGNAGTWIYNAKSLGYKTGKTPRVGSIVVTTENRYYGHVALVEKVSGGIITVSEMNYVRWAKTNQRTLPSSSRSIKGYIY